MSDSEFSSNNNLDDSKLTKYILESSLVNSSLNLSINLESVGSIMINKHNEILKTSKDGTKKNICLFCLEDLIRTKDPNKKVQFAKLADHYESAHADKKEVKELKSILKTKLVKSLARTDGLSFKTGIQSNQVHGQL